jgi:hypothetical protein
MAMPGDGAVQVRTISDLVPRDCKVGKIKMVKNGGGAVFDLPSNVAQALVASGIDGFVIERISSLPELEPEFDRFDRGGRARGGGGGGYRGGGGGYRGGGGGAFLHKLTSLVHLRPLVRGYVRRRAARG